jgi:ABC-type lipoprotein export system ATPase subunit
MAHSGSHLLLRVGGVTRVFLTEDVETHALSGVHLSIDKGEYVSIMVTHDPRYARHADRTIPLFDGQVVAEATEVLAGAIAPALS